MESRGKGGLGYKSEVVGCGCWGLETNCIIEEYFAVIWWYSSTQLFAQGNISTK